MDSKIYPLIGPYYQQGQITVHTIPAGGCISDAADEAYHIIYLLEGVVNVQSISYKGRRVLLDEVRPGAFSGHISRLRGYSFDAHLVAQRDCVYLSFTDGLFLKLMEEPAFALEFYRSTSNRTYFMYRKFLGLTLFTAEENAAMYAILREDRLHNCTLDVISEEIGISRRSLCYILRRWQSRGIIQRQDKGYRLLDRPALESLSRQIQQFYHRD